MSNRWIGSRFLTLALLGLGFATPRPGLAMSAMAMDPSTPESFRQIEQPLPVKLAVTAGGLSLIGLELWWFLFSQRQTQKADLASAVQQITITVDGGYSPDHIELTWGKPVRLSFIRKDPSSCLETVILPDFHRSVALPLNQTTVVDLPAPSPGKYGFHCGMNLYRGTLIVQSGQP